ncbi:MULTISPECIES: hypothetical protein [unclassified Pseudomonas]|uniref:hypothetical protein n=1 Tax=unclassified Pseudomonas TaxID=196821 RepID=UPI0024485DB9|nr:MULTISPECIES: hypothetical protein [unclassified Pseudomonas]MDG9930696.1 hypothetical protein [Pseudomonas sp. GD04042]MDH0485155.1 hypothetical protein [Pseudomonas sp. GD04015]MDH0606515.1 hypothetical protein [Pseudomonas sp. GD03869]
MRKSLMAACLLGLSVTAYGDSGPANYLISKTEGASTPMISTSWGVWDGMIGLESYMSPYATHELVFEFKSTNYFSPAPINGNPRDNIGHFAVGVRAGYSANGLEGRGVIIGNVSGYGVFPNSPCGQTSLKSTIAIEHYYGYAGNCVFGPSTQGPQLQDGIKYRVRVVSSYGGVLFPNNYRTAYDIWQAQPNGSWSHLTGKSVMEPVNGPTPLGNGYVTPPIVPPLDSQGFFMAEVFSSHAWSVEVTNLVSKTCSSFTHCTQF